MKELIKQILREEIENNNQEPEVVIKPSELISSI